MSLKISAGTSVSAFAPVPPGTHLARLYRIVDLGTQQSEWMGKTKETKKVMFQWEVHSEDDQGNPLVTSKGEPMTISKNYSLYMSEKASLRIDLQGLRGKPFVNDEEARSIGWNPQDLLGSWAKILVETSIGKEGKEFTNITKIIKLRPSEISTVPEGFNECQLFDLDKPNMALFDTFSTYLKAKIESTKEWQSRNNTKQDAKQYASAKGGYTPEVDDDIPF
jgi:hypothetical protein